MIKTIQTRIRCPPPPATPNRLAIICDLWLSHLLTGHLPVLFVLAQVRSCQTNPCFAGVRCEDTDRGYRCGACPRGYYGDGMRCAKIPSCRDNPCFRGMYVLIRTSMDSKYILTATFTSEYPIGRIKTKTLKKVKRKHRLDIKYAGLPKQQ